MDNREAVNWLINISADIGKAEHSDLWHYEQALTEIKDMLESAQPVLTCKGCKYDYYEYAGCRNCLRREWDLYEPENDDLISRQTAIDAYGDWYVEEGTAEGFIGTVKQLLEGLPPVTQELLYSGAISLDKQKILQAGYEGREYDFYIGGRLFSIREKAQ